MTIIRTLNRLRNGDGESDSFGRGFALAALIGLPLYVAIVVLRTTGHGL